MSKCKYCEKEFEAQYKQRKFCSDKCLNLFYKKYKKDIYKSVVKTKKICQHCGKEFLGRTNQRFCSKNCSAKSRYIPKKNTIKKKCKYCGKEFIPKISVQKYCSEKCRTEHNRVFNNKKYRENKSKGIYLYEQVYSSVCFVCGEEIPYGKTIHRKCLKYTKFEIDEDCIY